MAKRRPEDPPKGAPAWQSTFSDLMNLLLCFFVLLFSMSTVDAEKFQLVIASLTSSVSVLPGGSTSIGDGRLVGAGVSQLEFLDKYYNDLANSKSTTESTTEGDDKNAEEQYEQMELFLPALGVNSGEKHAAALLPPVLQSKETIVNRSSHIVSVKIIHAEDSTFFVQAIILIVFHYITHIARSSHYNHIICILLLFLIFFSNLAYYNPDNLKYQTVYVFFSSFREFI